MEKAGGISKLVTVMTITELLDVVVNTAGTPLTIVSTFVELPCMKVKVPAGDSVASTYGSQILMSNWLLPEGIGTSLQTPFLEIYEVLSFSLSSPIIVTELPLDNVPVNSEYASFLVMSIARIMVPVVT